MKYGLVEIEPHFGLYAIHDKMTNVEIGIIALDTIFPEGLLNSLDDNTYDKMMQLTIKNRMCHIRSFEIHDEYRGQGHAVEVLVNLDLLLSDMGYDVVTLAPYPVEDDKHFKSREIHWKTLLKLYTRANYNPIASFIKDMGFSQVGLIMGKRISGGVFV